MIIFMVISFFVSFWLTKKYVNWRAEGSLSLTEMVVLSFAVSVWTTLSLVVGVLLLLVGVEGFLLRNGSRQPKKEVVEVERS